MFPEVLKTGPARLRALGLNEKWLQDRIEEDPSILGLGDVQVIRREKQQSSGGRLDFLLYDPDQEVRYEVEVMLGSLDESHIIRTIEYWDIERQRFPTYEHRAVIVAEEITARFFNVIRLLNRAVPMIALQLTAIPVDGRHVILHCIKVLDVYEEAEPEEDVAGDPVDRKYWERRGSPAAMAAMDRVIGLVGESFGSARPTYNKNHVALGTVGRNFCWFHPPKAASHCHVRVRAPADTRDDLVRTFEETGLYVRPFQRKQITLKLALDDIETHRALLLRLLRDCEKDSQQAD
jgi:hypothetical protein